MLKPYSQLNLLEAGCDEAGRGCLAGPVFAAAVILPQDYQNPLLNDSKKISIKNRNILRNHIESDALAWSVAYLDNYEIDKINILNASIQAMQNAVLTLNVKPELLLIDGNKFKPLNDYKYNCIVKGDGIYASIAAASILAKTHRDEFMEILSEKYPKYKWDKNKGYPTKAHKQAIIEFGISEYHRKSYNLIEKQLKLF